MKSLNEHYGFTLIEVLLSTGLGFVVLLIAAVLLLKQAEELNILSDRIEANNIQIELQRSFMDPLSCAENLLTPFSIDDALSTNSSYRVPLNRLIERPTSPRTIVQVGQPLSSSSPHLTVTQIEARSFKRLSSNTYRFDLKVFLNNTKGPPVLPISIPKLRVQTDPASPANAKTVVSCGAGGLTGGIGSCRRVEATSPGINRVRALCDPGERLLTGGGTCLTATGEPWSTTVSISDFGYLRLSHPVNFGGRLGWEVDCYNDFSANTVRSRAYVFCCS